MSAVASNFAINILLAGSLNQVWGMLNNLQLVLHSPLINVQFPANAFLVFDVMISVATFDLLPTDLILPELFTNLPEDDPFTDKFDRLGIGSRFLVMNMGTMLLIFMFYIILYFIYPCVRFFRHDIKCCKKTAKKLKPMLFWNHSILFLLEGYLDILIAAFINLVFLRNGEFDWSSWSVVVTNFLCIFLLLCCAFLFIFTTVYLWPRFGKLNKSKFKDRFLPIYEMINLRHGKWTMLWPVFFMLRRILFVVAICFLIEYAVIQILFFLVPTLFVLVIIALV